MGTKYCRGCDAQTCTCCSDGWYECPLCYGDFCMPCSSTEGEYREVGWICNSCWEKFKDFTLEELENIKPALCDFCGEQLGYIKEMNEINYVCKDCEEEYELTELTYDDGYYRPWEK